jgi:hypothetical protein
MNSQIRVESADRIALNAALDHSKEQDKTITQQHETILSQAEEIRQLRRSLQRVKNEVTEPTARAYDTPYEAQMPQMNRPPCPTCGK